MWWRQLVAACRGGSNFQGFLVTSLPYFSHFASLANLLGTSSQAHQLKLAMSLKAVKSLFLLSVELYRNFT